MSVLQTLMPVTFQKHKMCLAGAVDYCLIILIVKEYFEPVEEAVVLWAFMSKVQLRFRAGYLLASWPGSSVGMATCYVLDGSEIESR
jgi:hypothetical protein